MLGGLVVPPVAMVTLPVRNVHLRRQTGSSFPCLAQRSAAAGESRGAPGQHHLHPGSRGCPAQPREGVLLPAIHPLCQANHAQPQSSMAPLGLSPPPSPPRTLQNPPHLLEAQARLFSSSLAHPQGCLPFSPHQHPWGGTVTQQPPVRERQQQDLTCASSERKIHSHGCTGRCGQGSTGSPW